MDIKEGKYYESKEGKILGPMELNGRYFTTDTTGGQQWYQNGLYSIWDTAHPQTLIKEITKDNIPPNVYYGGHNFYDSNRKGMGVDFWNKWCKVKHLFPLLSDTNKQSAAPCIVIEEGKYYKTRNKNLVMGPMKRCYRANGNYVFTNGNLSGPSCTWTKDGTYNEGHLSDLDLVREVPVPQGASSVPQESKGVTMTVSTVMALDSEKTKNSHPTDLQTVCSVLASAGKFSGRIAAKLINYWLVEPVANVAKKAMAATRYVFLANVLFCIYGAIYHPETTMKFVKSLIPKVTIEAPEILK